MGQCGSVPGLSAEEKSVLQESWAVISKNKKQSGIELFQELFAQYPELKQKFPFADVPDDELSRHPKFLAHILSIMFSATSMIESLDCNEIVESMIAKQVTNHKARGVTPVHFKILAGVIGKAFGKYLTEESTKVWLHALESFNAIAERTLQRPE